MTAAPVFEPRSRPPFRERVMALAGRGGYREPGQGSSERQTVPPDHMVAAALAFGRSGPDDVGPDLALAMATGRIGEAQTLRVLRWLGGALAGERAASLKRVRPYLGHVAIYALNATTKGWQVPPAPDGVESKDWGEAVLFACLLIEHAAEDALALAARRWRA